MKDGIFINIEQIQNLKQDLLAYFFDTNAKDFKGKMFAKQGFEEKCVCIQFMQIPEIIPLNQRQIALMKDKNHFAAIVFPKFEVTNATNDVFKFYVQVKRKKAEIGKDGVKDGYFEIQLYLKSKPENYKTVRIVWDFVCEELKFEHIGKRAEMKRNSCDQIDGFLSRSIDASELAFIVNIRILS